DVTDPSAWTLALKDNIVDLSSISLPVSNKGQDSLNSPLEQFQAHSVGSQLLKTLEGIVV
ncbi:MAG: hypothetical protein ACKO9W_00260, partial [Bacteroidota bacterium]